MALEAGTHCSPFLRPALGMASHPALRQDQSPPAAAHPCPTPRLQHLSVPQSLPLISASRWLLKRGELSVVEEAGLFRKLASRPTCYLFLFNDVLVVTKKKRWARGVARLHTRPAGGAQLHTRPRQGVPGCTHGPAGGCPDAYMALPWGGQQLPPQGQEGRGQSWPEPPLTSELGAHNWGPLPG